MLLDVGLSVLKSVGSSAVLRECSSVELHDSDFRVYFFCVFNINILSALRAYVCLLAILVMAKFEYSSMQLKIRKVPLV